MGLAIALVITSIFAAERMVLGELCTNTSCGPCVSANYLLDDMRLVSPYLQRLALIRYHASWPSSSDPFYAMNTSQNTARIVTYYGVTGVPSFFVDGTVSSSYVSSVNTRLTTASPISISATYTPGLFTKSGILTTATINLTVNVETAVSGDLRLYYVLVEDDYYFAAPNGQRWFYEAMREMWPSATGQSVTYTSTGIYTYSQVIDFDNASVPNNCSVIIFVQNNSTKQIIQAARVYVAERRFTASPKAQAGITPTLTDPGNFDFLIFDQGRLGNGYTTYITTSFPSGWTYTASNSHGSFTGSTSFSLASLGVENFDVTINPNGHEGIGEMTVRIVPTIGDPETLTLKYTAGAKILLVDADGGQNYNTWLEGSLDRLGASWGTYNRDVYGSPSSAFLSQFEVVVWSTGSNYSSVLTSTEATNLQNFLNGGGRLYFSSCEIGWYQDASGGGATSLTSFYNNYLRATYAGDSAYSRTVNGVAGDPVGNGLTFSLTGGDGAGNQRYCDYITAYTGGTVCLNYATAGQYAGVRYDSGTYKVVYTAFSFEGVSTQATRDTLMYRIIYWLSPLSLGVEENSALPEKLALSVSPNPFNAQTSISVDLPDGGSVDVIDITGKVVATLGKGLSAGKYNLPFDGSNCSSGIYFVRANSGDNFAVAKTVLIK